MPIDNCLRHCRASQIRVRRDENLETNNVVESINNGDVDDDTIKIINALKKVKVKDRMYHFKKYRECFIGSEAVDVLIESGFAKSRGDAVKLGRMLQKEYLLFDHVCGNHEFEDDYLFFRLVSAERAKVFTTPSKPFIIFTVGVRGAGKKYTINNLVQRGLLPLLGFVTIDPYEVRRRLPEFEIYTKENPENANDHTRKEAEYICEILVLAALKVGMNIVFHSCMSDVGWYQNYFNSLRSENTSYKIAMFHVDASKKNVLKRARKVGNKIGNSVETELIEKQVEISSQSVKSIAPLVDYFCKIGNDIDNGDVTILTEGETCYNFQSHWLQSSIYQERKKDAYDHAIQGKNVFLDTDDTQMTEKNVNLKNDSNHKMTRRVSLSEEIFNIDDASDAISNASLVTPSMKPGRRFQSFSAAKSTEMNHKNLDLTFFGAFSAIRKRLDYTYHCNYTKVRQGLQDSIIMDMLNTALLTDINGSVCTTPADPWIVFTAGAMGAGKSYTINKLVDKGRFPLLAFVRVDPDEIRRHLPEFTLYVNQHPELAGELTRKEAGFISEILTMAALLAGKNVLVDGSLRDSKWYEAYFKLLRNEYSNLRIGILHIVAPRNAVLQRAADRAKKTGRVVPKETLEMALDQVPRSVKVLAPLADYFAELNNAPNTIDIELLNQDEDWDDFQCQWLQTCLLNSIVNDDNRYNWKTRYSKSLSQKFEFHEV